MERRPQPKNAGVRDAIRGPRPELLHWESLDCFLGRLRRHNLSKNPHCLFTLLARDIVMSDEPHSGPAGSVRQHAPVSHGGRQLDCRHSGGPAVEEQNVGLDLKGINSDAGHPR